MSEISLIYNRFVERLHQLSLPIAQHYSGGSTDAKQQFLLNNFPFHLPTEVHNYYQLCQPLPVEKQNQYLLFPQGYIISLAEALQTRTIYLSIEESTANQYVTLYGELKDLADELAAIERPQLWHPQWLPVFSYDGSEYWITICSKEKKDRSPIYFISIQSEADFYLAYDSLTNMLLTIVEAFEVGAYWVTRDGLLAQRRTMLAPIFSKYNPQARSYQLNMAGAKDEYELLNLLQTEDVLLLPKIQRALLMLGDASIVLPLTGYLHHPNLSVKIAMIEILGELADQRAIDSLVNVLKHEPLEEVRIAIIRSLGKLGGEQAFDTLMTALSRAVGQELTAIIEAFGILQDSRCVATLLSLLDSNEPTIQCSIIDSLTALGDPRSLEPIRKKLHHSNLAVRQAAHEALKWLTVDNTE